MERIKDLDISTLTRDAKYVNTLLKTNKDKFITTTDLFIMLPDKFIDRGIATIGNITSTVGVFAIIDPVSKKYSVSLIPTNLTIIPLELNNIIVDEESYTVLKIEKGMPILNSIIAIKNKSFAYELFDLFYVQAKIPWFLKATDIHKVFGNIEKYTGSRAGNFGLMFELLSSLITKDPKNLKVFFRNTITNQKMIEESNVKYRGLKDIFTTVTSNLNKIVGSYLKDSLLSAMNNPATETSRLEDIIRD